MAIYTRSTTQVIHTTQARAWAFFSNPRNLARITPPELGFEIRTHDLPERIRPGLMIAYRVRPLLGVPLTWLTEITHVDEGVSFVDEQRVGPYALWHHEHRFHERADGCVEMTDEITYVLPLGPLGALFHGWLVRPQLDRVFAYRNQAVERLFPA